MPDITRDELIEIIGRVMVGDSNTDYFLRLLNANMSYPAITDLIFHPPPESRDASAEQIVDIALSHRPIAM
ncbi:hypothetical protein [Nocardia altamirensis]|uniref:hypothetical protein n=1 Tax=Nocardia altamirensis TaxID=472158 RepID=UPI00083FE88F|nr:hypothetical protein [Nocardia altamirensis]